MTMPSSQLKQVRLNKGLSLDEVHKKTKIHANILKAIEGDALSDLSPVYLKSFIKLYCNFLGVDPKEYVPEHKEAQRSFVSAASGDRKRDARASSSQPAFIRGILDRMRSFDYIKAAKGALVVFLIFLVMFGFIKLGKFIAAKRHSYAARHDKMTAALAKAEKTPKAASLAQKASSPAGSVMKPLSSTSSGVNLTIRAKDNCLIDLKGDGKLLFKGILAKGRAENWSAKEKMTLSLGDAGAVEVQVNGQVFPALGRKGQPRKNITITKDGLS